MATGHKDIWVYVEHREGAPLEVSYEMLEDARKLADSLREKVVALVLGGPAVPDFAQAVTEHGADVVYVGCHSYLESYESETFVQALFQVCHHFQPAAVMLPATPNGQDVAARLAARLQVGLVSFCLKFAIGPDKTIQGVKEAYNGRVYATFACCGERPHLFTFKPGSAGVGAPDKRRRASVAELPPLDLTDMVRKTRTVTYIPADPHTVDLTEADMIVAGGAGVRTKEMFTLLQELADALGASVGGTRPAVDQGWIPFERQIGQTGKIVSPRLYLSAGISGASLHAMGIKDSEHIIAINTDKNAPIFKLSQLAAVGDLREVVPLLLQRLKKYRTESPHKSNPA